MTHAALSRKGYSVLIGLVGFALVAALVSLAVFATPKAESATAFLVRGDIIKLDKTNGNFHMYIRHANSAATNFAGEVHEINANKATFYKYDSKQRKVRSTFGSTINNGGIEVVVKGTIDGSNSFKANWVVRNDNTVKIRGIVRGQSVSNNYLEVEIDQVLFEATGKAYKATTFVKGEKVLVHYDQDSTKFISRGGNAMNEDEISDNDEKVTVENVEVRFGSRFEADVSSTITDGRWLF